MYTITLSKFFYDFIIRFMNTAGLFRIFRVFGYPSYVRSTSPRIIEILLYYARCTKHFEISLVL